ncbi:hypothetical protein T265_01235 [Opisthorchis viverrini]|uniref:Uncharacterized protein n=1 Tax=Opisthorchis viverrini TaxID=6198 RepID=A0A075AJ46_OPIVI|nr:hypothetical protein T265_01235 [Opisthorchis viverrini]KER32749.1 hypothetical protein T265_01235 [Opisthorchis viverrini]
MTRWVIVRLPTELAYPSTYATQLSQALWSTLVSMTKGRLVTMTTPKVSNSRPQLIVPDLDMPENTCSGNKRSTRKGPINKKSQATVINTFMRTISPNSHHYFPEVCVQSLGPNSRPKSRTTKLIT